MNNKIKVIVLSYNTSTYNSLVLCESKKAQLEKLGYNLKRTEQLGINLFKLVYELNSSKVVATK